MRSMDDKDLHILNLLQEDCRMSLTKLAAHIGLSIDATKKRLKKLEKNEHFFPKIQLRPRHFGYPYIVEVKIKLHNYNNTTLESFVNYLQEHPRVAELLSISGEWDYTVVLIAKDHEDLARLGDEIRDKFNSIIADWQEALTKIAYKFEKYDLLKLKAYEEGLR